MFESPTKSSSLQDQAQASNALSPAWRVRSHGSDAAGAEENVSLLPFVSETWDSGMETQRGSNKRGRDAVCPLAQMSPLLLPSVSG